MVLKEKDGVISGYEKESPYAEKNNMFLPHDTVAINNDAFRGFWNLGSVTFNEGLQYIGDFAFASCSELRTLYIPDSVRHIGFGAFNGCVGLRKVSVPAHLDVDNAFLMCSPDLEISKREKVSDNADTSSDAGAEPSETDYKSLFLELMYMNDAHEKEKVLDRICDEDIKIPVSVYLFSELKSKKAEEYISDNFQAVMHYLVDRKDINGMNAVMEIANKKDR